MKLLFDQNISHRIISKIEDIFPNASQVRSLGLENASDIAIWEYAKLNGYTIVTFDSDYADIANIKLSLPKIIWLRTGNLTTDNVIEILSKHKIIITAFIEEKEFDKSYCLEID